MTSIPESVVAAKVVRNDGRTPFLRPQKGVAPVDGDDLVTRAWAIANLGGGGGGIVDGDKGDITVATGGTVWTIDAAAVTNAKLANMPAGAMKGRKAAGGAGVPQDLTPAEARTELGLGELATLATPDADRVAGTDGMGTVTMLRGSDIATLLGLGDLAYLSDVDASLIASGVVAPARLGAGTASSGTFLRGDGAWSATSVFAAASHSHAASDITSGTMAASRLGSGAADSTTFLRGDGTWATPPGGGGGIEFGVAKRLAYLRL